MKNPAFEQPFKSARTNSRSLLFRSRRCGRPCRPGSLSGLASSSMDMQTWRVVLRILSMCCTPWASQPLFCWLGMLEKVRMISGIRKQQPGLPGKPTRDPPDAKFSLFTSLHPLRAIALTAFAAALTAWTPTAHATIGVWPDTFRARQMPASGGTQYVRVGGQGPMVLLLHGFGDTGDMWVPLAEALAKNHTVIVPDLRGMGLSSHPEDGYEKTGQARDMASILDELGIQEIALVTHDIGNMVGYAFAALYPQRVTKWVVMDASLPGIGHWDDQLKNPKVWHFNFHGPDVERLVAGRERILLDRFWNESSADPKSIDEATREHYAKLY